jgi:SAM-dependent methyltransferase
MFDPSLSNLRSVAGSPSACLICGHAIDPAQAAEFGEVRGNTQRFLTARFKLWKCPECHSIHNIEAVDFKDIYSDYPLNNRPLDYFARVTLGNLLKRLVKAGLKKTDSILDYGCGNGLFVEYLRAQGYEDVSGYDPFVAPYAHIEQGRIFDCIVANDVIEHVPNPKQMLAECSNLCRPQGLVYVGTADSEPVDMGELDSQVMRLHQPFHRVLINQRSLERLAESAGFKILSAYKRSYMDTWFPFANYRFLDEFNGALGHNMDKAFDPASASLVARRPKLLFFAFFGHLVPSAFEPAVVLRKP